MSEPVYDQRESLHDAGGFDQRPGSLEATRGTSAKLDAIKGSYGGRPVVILRNGGVQVGVLTVREAYKFAERVADLADIIGHDARRGQD